MSAFSMDTIVKFPSRKNIVAAKYQRNDPKEAEENNFRHCVCDTLIVHYKRARDHLVGLELHVINENDREFLNWNSWEGAVLRLVMFCMTSLTLLKRPPVDA